MSAMMMSPLLPAAPSSTSKMSETRGRAAADEGFGELVAGEKRSSGRERVSEPLATDEAEIDAARDQAETGEDGGIGEEATADTIVSAKVFALSHGLDKPASAAGAADGPGDGGDTEDGAEGETAPNEAMGRVAREDVPAGEDVRAGLNAASQKPQAQEPAQDEDGDAPAAPADVKNAPPPRGMAESAAAIRDAVAAGDMQGRAQAVAGLVELATARKEVRPAPAGDTALAPDAPVAETPDKRLDPAAGEHAVRGGARMADPVEARGAKDGAARKAEGEAVKPPASRQPSAAAQPQADPSAQRPAVGSGVAFSVVEAVRNNANWSAFLKAPTAQYREAPNGQGQTLQAIKVQLHPAELGTLTLNLRATGNRISVDIKAEEQTARKLVADGLESVARSFQTLGYQVDQVNLAGSDSSNASLDQWAAGNRERGETDGRKQDGEYANQAGRDDLANTSRGGEETSPGRPGGGRTLYI